MNLVGKFLAAFVLLGAAAALPASAQTVINFDDGTAEAAVAGTYVPLGVTFTGTSFTSNFGLPGSSGTLGIISTTQGFEFGSDNPIIGTFAQSVSSVTLRGIDVGQAGIELAAYDASGTLVGTDQFFGTGIGVGAYQDLTVSAAGIASFQAFQPLTKNGTNSFGDGVLFENLAFTTASIAAAAPEPASWVMMIIGFAVVGFAVRAAKHRSDAKFDARIKKITYGLIA